MGENIEVKDVQKTEYLDKNGLDMLWAKVKENTRNQVEVESNRAVEQETRIIETKADKSEFSNYVPSATFTALEKKVSANTAAISNKQNAGNYLHYETLNNEGYYEIPDIRIPGSGGSTKTDIDSQSISVNCDYPASHTTITCDGISNTDNNANHVYATDGSIADLTQYAKKTDIPEVDASDFISKTATNITTGGFGQIRTVDTINNNIGVGNNTSSLAYIGEGELGVIGYRDGYATESFRYTNTYGLETTNTSGYKNVKIPCDSNKVSIYKGNSNNYCTDYRYSGVVLGENNDNNNLLNTNGGYKTIGTDIAPLENSKVPTAYLTAATKEELGVVKVGDGLNVTDGTISVDTTAIGSGKYIPYESIADDDNILYKTYVMKHNEGILFDSSSGNVSIKDGEVIVKNANHKIAVTSTFIWLLGPNDYGEDDSSLLFELNKDGLRLRHGDNDHVLTSYGSTIDITQYAKKTELPTVPTKTSELQNDSEFITKSVYDEKIAALEARIAALEAKHTETA